MKTWWLRLLAFLHRFDRIFFAGPAVFNYPGKAIKGYRSVNLLIAYWLRAFTVLYFTWAGRVLFVVSGYFLLAGMLTLLMPMYMLSIAMISMFIVNIVMGWWFRPRLQIKRNTPRTVSALQTFTINYTIKNTQVREAWDLLVDTISFPGAIKLIAGRSYIERLPADHKFQAHNRATARRRGVFQLPLPVVSSAFPFGLWRWSSVGGSNPPIIVYPHYHRLQAVHLPGDHLSQLPNDRVYAAAVGQSMEFLGCREYRFGDNPRHIHAQSWARIGEPIVKEFSDEYSGHVIIFIDTGTTPITGWRRYVNDTDNKFEASLSLAAAVIDFLIADNYRIKLLVNSPTGVVSLMADGATADLEVALTQLAVIMANPGAQSYRLDSEIKMEIAGTACAIMLFLQWNGQCERFINDFQELGVAIKPIGIVDREKSSGSEPSAGVKEIDMEAILSGKVREI